MSRKIVIVLVACDVENVVAPMGISNFAGEMVLGLEETSTISLCSDVDKFDASLSSKGGPDSPQGNQKYNSKALSKFHFQGQQLDHGMGFEISNKLFQTFIMLY